MVAVVVAVPLYRCLLTTSQKVAAMGLNAGAKAEKLTPYFAIAVRLNLPRDRHRNPPNAQIPT